MTVDARLSSPYSHFAITKSIEEAKAHTLKLLISKYTIQCTITSDQVLKPTPIRYPRF